MRLLTRKDHGGRLNPPDIGLGLLLRNASRAFGSALARRVAKYGITHSEFTHLWYISVGEGVSASEISRRVGVKKASSTSALDTLERKGFIRRETNKSDGRKIHLHLTAEGKVLMKRLRKCAVEVNILARGNLTIMNTSELFSMLSDIIQNLQGEVSVDAEDEALTVRRTVNPRSTVSARITGVGSDNT